jgi:hypothetical protein
LSNSYGSGRAERFHRHLHFVKAILSLVEALLFLIIVPALYLQLAAEYPGIGLAASAGMAGTALFIGSVFIVLNFGAQLLGNERLPGLCLRILSLIVIAFYFVAVLGRAFTIALPGSFWLTASIYPVTRILAAISLLNALPSAAEYFEARRRIMPAD